MTFSIIIYLCGMALFFITYSAASYKLMIPGRTSMAVVRRIQDINLSEKELEQKYKPLHERVLGPIAEGIMRNIKLNLLSRIELEEKLTMARVEKTPEEFIAKQITTALAFFSMGLLFVIALGMPLLLLLGVFLGGLGFIMPNQDLNKRMAEVKNQVVIELPDFLDMLVLSLRAGHNLHSAVKRAADQAGPALRPLLVKLQADMELADVKKDALWEFAENTGVQEVKDFVSALEIGMDARVKEAEEIYRSQSKIMRDLRVLAIRKHTRSIPSKLRFVQLWVYFNCIAIPIIAAVAQFSTFLK